MSRVASACNMICILGGEVTTCCLLYEVDILLNWYQNSRKDSQAGKMGSAECKLPFLHGNNDVPYRVTNKYYLCRMVGTSQSGFRHLVAVAIRHLQRKNVAVYFKRTKFSPTEKLCPISVHNFAHRFYSGSVPYVMINDAGWAKKILLEETHSFQAKGVSKTSQSKLPQGYEGSFGNGYRSYRSCDY